MTSALMRLMGACGVRDFTLKDLMKPEPKRTVRHLRYLTRHWKGDMWKTLPALPAPVQSTLAGRRCRKLTPQRRRRPCSAIINFAKFREERLANYQAFMAETDALNEEKNKLEDGNEERAARILAIKEARAAEEEAVVKLQQEVDVLAQEISRANAVQQGLQGEVREVKDKTTNVQDSIAGKTFQIQSREQERVTLLGQIVQSPDRIKREIVEMGTAVEQEKENVDFMGQKVRELQAREDALVQAKADLTKSSKLLDETTAQLTKQHQAREEVEAMKEQIGVRQQQLKELAASEQQLKRQETLAKERVARVSRQREQRQDAAKMSLEEVRKERELIEKDRLTSRSKASENEAKARALEEEVASFEQAHEAELQELQKEFGALHEEVSRSLGTDGMLCRALVSARCRPVGSGGGGG